MSDAGELLTDEDFEEMVERGEATVWCGERSRIFLKRVHYERSGETVLEVGPAEGDMMEILAAVPALEAWAREIGCGSVLVYSSRDGWERALAPLGYGRAQVVLRKVLH